ncbi:MAG: metal ABC transporter ATP-binding protein [Weeksellaceae bacterium]|nr:metal ABC transporter ATP-binding protein [Weeksellaceae bacterium]
MKDTAIRMDDLTVVYKDKPVLWDVDWQVNVGDFRCIVGPNGAGKSTLIKSLLGMIEPIAGSISVFGKNFKPSDNHIAYVPQRSGVDWDFPVNVLDVVMMGSYGKLSWFKSPGKSEQRKAMECLEMLQMQNFANRHISQLSGGQQQRVFLARALMQNAPIMLLDEPLQGVDAKTEEIVMRLLRELQQAGRTIVVVHHNLQTVKRFFDQVTLLNVVIIASGEVSDVFTEENVRKTYHEKPMNNFLQSLKS